jgi:hypothetical protein
MGLMRERWEVTKSIRDNIACDLTYIADWIETAEGPGGGLTRRDAGYIRARIMDAANRIASIPVTMAESEEDDGEPAKPAGKRPRAKKRIPAAPAGRESRIGRVRGISPGLSSEAIRYSELFGGVREYGPRGVVFGPPPENPEEEVGTQPIWESEGEGAE